MARIIPNDTKEFHNSYGEKLIYEALKNLSNEYINAAFPKDSPMRLLFKSSTVVLLGAGIMHLPKPPDRVSPAAPDTRCETI